MSNDRARLTEWVVRRVTEHWSTNKKAILLSKLGYDARQEFSALAEIIPEGLKRFLSSLDEIQVLTHPSIPQMVGAAPANERIESIESALTEGTSEQRHLSRPRFDQELWKAFYTHSDQKRFVVLLADQSGKIQIVKEALPGQLSLEILPSDVATTTPEMSLTQKVSEVENRILAWASRNSVDISKLQESHQARVNRERNTHQPNSNGGMGAFGTLDRMDQSRIMIPLDIVLKLLEKNN